MELYLGFFTVTKNNSFYICVIGGLLQYGRFKRDNKTRKAIIKLGLIQIINKKLVKGNSNLRFSKTGNKNLS